MVGGKQLSLLADVSAAVLLTLDNGGRCIAVSGKNGMGEPVDINMLTGKYLQDLVPGNIAGSISKIFEKAVSTGEFREFEFENPENGSVHHFSGIFIPQKDYTVLTFLKNHSGTAEPFNEMKGSDIDNLLLHRISDLISERDPDGTFTYVSPAFESVLGYSPSELNGKKIFEFLHPDEVEQYRTEYKQALNGNTLVSELRFRHSLGHYVWIKSKIEIVRDEKEVPVKVISIITDISDKVAALMELEKSEMKFRSLFENSPIGISLEFKDRLLNVNKKYCQMFGYDSAEELVGTSFLDRISEEDRLFIGERIKNHKPGDKALQDNSITGIRKDGSSFPMRTGAAYINIPEGEATIGFIFDMTEINMREEKIKASLKEKETLIREIHHRVKNNLQVISSLLSLQTDQINHENYLSAFKDSIRRVKSMAIIHEKLYQSENLSKIEFSDYISNLFRYIKATSETGEYSALFELNSDKVFLSLDEAVPCGLILNELFSNAFKYGYNKNNEIRIHCSMKQKDNDITIIVKDEGAGLPDESIFGSNTETLGMVLITALIKQIHGTIDYAYNNGAEFKIQFTLKQV